jgi:hypothetical protein
MYVYMHDRSWTSPVAALTASAVVVVAVVVAWASPAAAVLPSFTGPTTVAVTTNATATLAGSGAPQVVDPDTTQLVLALTIGGPTVGRPTFTLDGTTGLIVVSGSAVKSRSASIAGTRSDINAALDGMRIEGGAPSQDYTLTLVADETPSAAGGTATRVITVEQKGTRPVNDMGSSFTVGTRAAKTLTGPLAPQVADVDSPTLEVELNIGHSDGIPVAEWPTFTLDGTAGLTVFLGSATASRSVGVSGTIAALNAALDGMVVTGGTTVGTFLIVVEADDVVGPTSGDGDLADTDFTSFTVTSNRPVNAGVRSVSLGTSSSRVLDPITVSDADSPVLDVELDMTRSGTDTTSVRPTFTLPTTAGLDVTGAPASTVSVRLVGPVAALNAALAAVVVHAPLVTGQYHLVVETDDGPGTDSGANADTDNATITVTGSPPTVSAGPDLTIGTSATRRLGSADAPSVGDPDDDRVEVTVEIQRTGSDTTSSRPRFDLPTTGLSVTSGSPTGSSFVTVTGPPATIDARLDDLGLIGAPTAGGYRLVVTVDEAVGATVGQVATDSANITVTALAPILTAPTGVSLVSSTTLVLDGADAPKVADTDSPEVDVELRLLPVPSSATVGTRFSLDGTAGLTVSGSATSSTQVSVTGPLSAVNAALDGLRLTAPAGAEQFSLRLTVDDNPGSGSGNTAVRTISGTVTAGPPGSIAGQSFAVASHTSSAPRIGPNAPQVTDADSPVVDVVVTTSSAAGLPVADQPTFTLDPLTELVLVSGTSLASHSVAMRGSPAAVNAALDGMVVRGGPTAGSFGIVVAVDDVPGAGGTPATATTVVTVTDAVPTVSGPGPAPHAHPGQVRDVPVAVADADSGELEARVRVLGTGAGRPQVRVTAPAGLVIDAGPVTGTDDLQVHGPTAEVAGALAGLRAVAGTATGTFTVEVTVDDARPEVGNTVTRTFTVVVDPPPSAPTAVGAQARSGGVGVSWSPPAAPGPNALTGYRVRVLQGATQVAAADVGPAARTQVFLGLANGTPFTVEVRALTALGPGAAATAGPVTPRVFSPFASAGAMVDRLHLDLLGRAPTSAERSAAVTGLGNGSVTPAGLVARLRASADNTGNVDPVTRLYRAYFLRIPDQAGLDFWIARRRSGQSLNQISQSFAQSPEFATLYGSLSNRGFVERIYENVLGRPGEPDGVTFWTGQLNSGARTRGQVMTGFSESSEYKAQQRAEVDVSVAFIALLGRRPTNGEHADAVAGIEGGTLTLAALHTAILTSDEYAALVT